MPLVIFLSLQAKYEAALGHSDSLKIVTPDWVTDCVKNNSRQEEKIYHPRLVVYPKPESPPKPATPPRAEPMEVWFLNGCYSDAGIKSNLTGVLQKHSKNIKKFRFNSMSLANFWLNRHNTHTDYIVTSRLLHNKHPSNFPVFHLDTVSAEMFMKT